LEDGEYCGGNAFQGQKLLTFVSWGEEVRITATTMTTTFFVWVI